MALTKFQRIILVSVGLVLLITILDIKGVNMFGLIGGLGGDSYKAIETQYLQFFWSFAFAIIFILAISWYIYTKDKSETLAIFLAPTTLLLFGVEDVLFYKIQGIPFETTMEWMHNIPGVQLVSQIMGSATITGIVLMVSAVVGIIISYFMIKYLQKAKW